MSDGTKVDRQVQGSGVYEADRDFLDWYSSQISEAQKAFPEDLCCLACLVHACAYARFRDVVRAVFARVRAGSPGGRGHVGTDELMSDLSSNLELPVPAIAAILSKADSESYQ